MLAASVVAAIVVAEPLIRAQGHSSRTSRPRIVLGSVGPHAVGVNGAPTVGSGDGQNVSVNVEPGPLTVLRSSSTVTLVRIPGTALVRGTVRGVRVVDARGKADGWQLRIVLPELGGRQATASIRRVLAMAASTSGIHARVDVALDRYGDARLLSADRDAGLGAFDVSLTVEARTSTAKPRRFTTPLRFELD